MNCQIQEKEGCDRKEAGGRAAESGARQRHSLGTDKAVRAAGTPVWDGKDGLAASQIKGSQRSDEEQKAQVKQIQFTRIALIIVEIIFYIQFRNTFLFF